MQHPYGWLSLLPPIVAIAMAMLTRRIVVSLLAGLLVGALITTGMNPFAAIGETLEIHLWKTLVDENKLRIFAFTLLMGAMVGVVNRAGGMRGLVELVTPLASNRQRGQLVTWLLGLFIFFDDYANTVLLGSTLRPLCDRLKISREKLAYLVDSTAAPVAGLALVSTWVAGEISFVQDGLDKLAGRPDLKAFDLFVASIPYRFYVLWALVFVALVALLQRDFGPMLRAEVDGLSGSRQPRAEELQPQEDRLAPDPNTPSRWYNAVLPVAVTVGAIVWLLYSTGRQSLLDADASAQPSLMEIFGEADSYYSLLWGALAGFLTAVVLCVGQRLLSSRDLTRAAGAGAQLMLPALVVLWLASALSSMTGKEAYAGDKPNPTSASAAATDEATTSANYPLSYRLYTGDYLSSLVGDRLPAALLPTVVFLLASATAFATGTSWGTMGILMPMVIPLTYGVLSAGEPSVAADDPILLTSIGSVLAGAIFGDHCSPISDTTVLSSQASGCNHVAHVWTQLPYALLVAAATVLFGTLPIGFGWPLWLLHIAGIAALALCLFLLGRRPEDQD